MGSGGEGVFSLRVDIKQVKADLLELARLQKTIVNSAGVPAIPSVPQLGTNAEGKPDFQNLAVQQAGRQKLLQIQEKEGLLDKERLKTLREQNQVLAVTPRTGTSAAAVQSRERYKAYTGESDVNVNATAAEIRRTEAAATRAYNKELERTGGDKGRAYIAADQKIRDIERQKVKSSEVSASALATQAEADKKSASESKKKADAEKADADRKKKADSPGYTKQRQAQIDAAAKTDQLSAQEYRDLQSLQSFRETQGKATKKSAYASEKKADADDESAKTAQQNASEEKKNSKDNAERARKEKNRIDQKAAALTPGTEEFARREQLAKISGETNSANQRIRSEAARKEQNAYDTTRAGLPRETFAKDASDEAKANAARRQIAAQYGRAKQEELYDQIKSNANVRADIAEEDALREARKAIEKKELNQRIGRIDPTTGRAPLRDDIVGGKVAAAAENAIQSADVGQALAADKAYIAAKASASASTASEAAQVATILAANKDYIASKVSSAASSAKEAAAVAAGLSANKEYTAAKISSAVSAAKEAASIAAGLSVNGEYLASKISSTVANAREAAAVASVLAINTEYIASKVASSVASAKEAASVAAGLATNEAYNSAKARAAVSTAQSTALQEIQIAVGKRAIVGDIADANIQQRITKDQLRLAEIERSVGTEAIKAKASRVIAEKEYQQSINREIASQLAAKGAPRYQRAQALSGNYNASGNPTDAGGLFASGFLTTLKFAVPSAVLFGAFAGLKESLTTASELQLAFAKLEAQSKSLGQEGSFSGLRSGLLDIAAETGQASLEVVDLGFQFQGAFGGDTQRTLEETRAAVVAVKTTGLGLKETTDAFTALVSSYNETGLSITEVNDTALVLESRLGALAKETISFSADLAPLASQVGLSAKQLETLGAASNKFSGKSGTALAEAFGRVLPSIQEKSVQILGIFDTLGDPAISAAIGENLQKGLTGPAFFQIAENYNKLSQQNKNLLLELLGGRREAQSIVGVLENPGSLNTDYATEGESAKRFAKVQETLGQKTKILKEELIQLGVTIFEGGLGQALSELANLGTRIIELFAGLANAAISFDDALGGIPIKLALVFAAFKGFQFAGRTGLVTFDRLTGFAGGGLGGGAAAGAAAGGAPVSGAALGTAAIAAQNLQREQLMGKAIKEETAVASLRQKVAQREQAIIASAQSRIKAGTPGVAGLGAAVPAGVKEFAKQPVSKGPVPTSGLGAAIAITGAAIVLDAYQNKKGEIETQAKNLNDRLTKATNEDLQAIADTRTDIFDAFSLRFFGQSLPEEMANAEINKRKVTNSPTTRALANKGTQQQIEAFTKSITDEEEQLLLNFFNQSDETRKFFEDQNLGEIGPAALRVNKDGKTIARGRPKEAKSLDKEALASKYQEIQRLAESGNEVAQNLVQNFEFLIQGKGTRADFLKSIGDLIEANNRDEAELLAGGASQLAAIGSEQAGQLYSSGVITETQYLDKIKKEVEFLKARQKENPTAFTPEDYAALTAAEKLITDVTANKATRILDVLKRLNSLGAPDESLATILSTINGERGAVSKEEQYALLDQGIAILQEQFQKEIDSIDDPLEAVRRAKEGFQLPRKFQELLVRQELEIDTSFNDQITAISQAAGLNLQDIADQVVQIILDTDATTQEAFISIIDNKLKELEGVAGAIAAIGGNTDTITQTIKDLESRRAAIAATQFRKPNELTTGTADPAKNEADAKKAVEEAAKAEIERQKAYLNYIKALNEGDAVTQAQLDIQIAQVDLANTVKGTAEWYQAQASLVSAQRAMRDAFESRMQSWYSYVQQLQSDDPIAATATGVDAARYALANSTPDNYYDNLSALDAAQKAQRDAIEARDDAYIAYWAATVAGDPIRAARDAQNTAQRDINTARNATERLNAMAAKISADRALQDAISNMYAAQSNLVTAQAEYLGDTVKASQLGVIEAQRLLREAQAKFAAGAGGKADVDNAQAELIRANASARDARISKLKDDYAFQFEMGQITRSQYIAYLEGLKSLADGNVQIIRDLDRQIKGLKDQLGADNQFNLPTNIALPTLYESRRLNQTAGGAGYQDNRNVNINIVVNDGMGVQDVQTVLSDALGTTRFGTRPGRY